MRKLRITMFALLATAFTSSAMAQPVPTATLDPCSTNAKLTAKIAIGSATTTRIINNTAGVNSTVNICSIWLNSVGGTSTLEYGTGASCATAATATALTGAFAAASTVQMGGNYTVINIPPLTSALQAVTTNTVGNSLCILSGTSTSATEGYVTYVIWSPM